MATIKNAMPGWSAPLRPLAVCAVLMASGPALAAPPLKLALVIGETAYANLPPLPACTGSANLVASALKNRGFEVTRKLDTTNGETGAALAGFAKSLADAPGSTAVMYFCGYAAGLDTRSFLLPISAAIERPFDLLTQGVVARSALSAVATGTAAGLLALDVFARPADSAPPALDRLAEGLALPNQGFLAAAEASAGAAPTPFATALATRLAAETVETAALVRDVQQRLAASQAAKLVVAQAPSSASFLVGAVPAEPTRPTKEESAQAPAPQPTPPATAPAPPPAPAPAEPSAPIATPAVPNAIPAMPEENQMTEADRRRVQAALAQLGYYDGRVDGQFGPETRAAIRRFQHEIGAEMTGRLTPEQAGGLLAGRR